MNTPTIEQIREGRDEALDHLGITPEEWAAMSTPRTWLKEQVRMSDLHHAAAVTVAQAEFATAEGFDRVSWSMTGIALGVMRVESLTRDDFALQA